MFISSYKIEGPRMIQNKSKYTKESTSWFTGPYRACKLTSPKTHLKLIKKVLNTLNNKIKALMQLRQCLKKIKVDIMIIHQSITTLMNSLFPTGKKTTLKEARVRLSKKPLPLKADMIGIRAFKCNKIKTNNSKLSSLAGGIQGIQSSKVMPQASFSKTHIGTQCLSMVVKM